MRPECASEMRVVYTREGAPARYAHLIARGHCCQPGRKRPEAWRPRSTRSPLMAESLSHWLGLREPADTAARSGVLTRTLAGAMPASEPVCVLDLATGTGSNIRYLMDRLPGRQRWLAVDRDAALLADLIDRVPTRKRRASDRRSSTGSCQRGIPQDGTR